MKLFASLLLLLTFQIDKQLRMLYRVGSSLSLSITHTLHLLFCYTYTYFLSLTLYIGISFYLYHTQFLYSYVFPTLTFSLTFYTNFSFSLSHFIPISDFLSHFIPISISLYYAFQSFSLFYLSLFILYTTLLSLSQHPISLTHWLSLSLSIRIWFCIHSLYI